MLLVELVLSLALLALAAAAYALTLVVMAAAGAIEGAAWLWLGFLQWWGPQPQSSRLGSPRNGPAKGAAEDPPRDGPEVEQGRMQISSQRLFKAAEACLVAHAHNVLAELIQEAPSDPGSFQPWTTDQGHPLHRLELLEGEAFMMRLGYLPHTAAPHDAAQKVAEANRAAAQATNPNPATPRTPDATKQP